MPLPSPPIPPARRTGADAGVGTDLDSHVGDQSNPHRTKLVALDDFTAGTTGQVVTRQSDGTYADATPPGASGGTPVGSAIPKPAAGIGSNGGSSSPSSQDHVHPSTGWTPADIGYKAWTFDGQYATATTALTSGMIYVVKAKVETDSTLASVMVPLTTGGSVLDGAYVGIYDTAGNQLAVSDNQNTAWASAGNKTVAMIAPTATIPAGTIIQVAILATWTSGTAPATRMFPGTTSAVNVGLSRVTTAGTGQTVLPATLAALSNGDKSLWLLVG